MAYTLEHDPFADGHLVALGGELDISANAELATVIAIATAAPGWRVVLDLSAVGFVDSTALGTILKASAEIELAGKRLLVVCAGGPVRRLLELTILTRRLWLCPTRAAALPTTSLPAP